MLKCEYLFVLTNDNHSLLIVYLCPVREYFTRRRTMIWKTHMHVKIFIIKVSMALNDKYITGGWIRIVIRSFRNNGGCRDKWQNCIQWPASRPLGEEASMNVGGSLSSRDLGNEAVHPCPFGSYNECLPSLITAKKTQTLINPIHLLQNLISSLHYK